jgi:HUS1 checkpoint protein
MNGKVLSITHEINILVLSKRRQEELKEPMCPTPDVS